jgi:carbon-monoxide dehydrogenase medium subunit
MIRFQYYEPKTVEEACRLLSEFEGEGKILAGGTDLIPRMKTGLVKPRGLVNIKKIPGLQGFNVDPETGISIGRSLISGPCDPSLLLEGFNRSHSGPIDRISQVRT